MLDELIEQDHIRAWHRGTVFPPYLDGYAEALVAQGFEPARVREKLCAVTWFAEHLRRQGAATLADVTDAHVGELAAAQGARRGPAGVAQRRKAAADPLQHLESRGAWRRPPKPKLAGPVEDFFCSLAEKRGLQPASIESPATRSGTRRETRSSG